MAINLFDANAYRAANSDLSSFSNEQALSHFQNYGLNEGRTFSPFANLNFYRASNSDLAGLNNRQLFDHLQNYGIREGRNFSPLVDVNIYRAYNSDLGTFNNEQLFEHLRNWGMGEGRSFSPFVNLNVYRAANPDLNAARIDNNQLFNHLAFYGLGEGRRFSVSFDSNYYRNTNSDLANLNHSQLLEHFGRYGLNEGRASSESFNIEYYLNNNSDLKAHFNNNKQQAQQHFEIYGCREGRRGAPSSQSITVSTDPSIGNTLDTACNLGILSSGSSLSVRESIDSLDRTDYYRFTLTNTSNFNLSLSDLSGESTKVQLLYDKNGDGQLYGYYKDSYNNNNVSINSALGAGTYFICVSYRSANTNYTLKVSATATRPTTPRDPGNTLDTALNIGTLNTNRSFSDFVGAFDDYDYYSFTLTNARYFMLSVTGYEQHINVSLIRDINGNGQVDNNERYYYQSTHSGGNLPSKYLSAGTYFVQVDPYSSNVNTNYTLNLFT